MIKSYRCRPRCFSDVVGLLYAVGGLTKAGDSLSTVEVMDPLTGRWNPAEAMSIRRSRVGVAVLRNKLYGTRSFSNVLFYFFESQFLLHIFSYWWLQWLGEAQYGRNFGWKQTDVESHRIHELQTFCGRSCSLERPPLCNHIKQI